MSSKGAMAGSTYDGPVTGASHNQASGSTNATASDTVAYDARAAARIQSPFCFGRSRASPGQSLHGERQSCVMWANIEFVMSSLARIREGATVKNTYSPQ